MTRALGAEHQRPQPCGRTAAAFLVLGCLALGASRAHARPSIWGRAAEPELDRRASVLDSVDKLIDDAERLHDEDPLSSVGRALYLRDARSRLSTLAADGSQDPEIGLRLGRVLYALYELDSDPNELSGAAESLRLVVHSASVPVSVRAEAWNDFAICLARLGRFNEEIAAYQEALAIEPHAEAQALLLANRAEGYMMQGRIELALAGYRASMKVTPGYALFHYGVTTFWSLGVALDRSGDLDGGLEQIRLARSYDPADQRLQSRSWFYMPAYDRYWYEALGHWLEARSTASPAERIAWYDEALASWRLYLSHAPSSDHWARLAARRQSQCERERKKALQRLPASKPSPAPGDDSQLSPPD